MESAPDSGVDIKKEVEAPLFAPCFLSDAAAGNTPHDHKGMGIPIRAALKTELNLPFPKWRETVFGLRKILNIPATMIPNRI